MTIDNALLKDEFDTLYKSLFKKSEDYVKIIAALSKRRGGYTRDEIVETSGLANGGGLTRKLDELEQCNFIRRYSPLRGRAPVYQLIDFYSFFYLQFLNGTRSYDRDAWMHLQATPRHNRWLGLSFERLCFAHIYEIQKALGITGVATKTYALLTDNVQMDMVIERADKVTSLCEMKYTSKPYAMTNDEADKIDRRKEVLSECLPTQKQVLVTIVSNRQPNNNIHYSRMVSNSLLLNSLFDD